MAMTELQEFPTPPRLIPALVAGFDAIANNILVIVFPIIFDLTIWFAPHLRIKKLLENLIGDMLSISQSEGGELAEIVSVSKDYWLQIAEQFNLAVVFRSYPVGIPSLMVSSLPALTPVGPPVMFEIPSFKTALIIIIFLLGFGLVFGTFYYLLVAQVALDGTLRWKKLFEKVIWACFQVILLACIWALLFFLVSIPASCIISIIGLAGFSIGQLGILFYGGFLLWLIFPLLFSSHGIFVNNLSVWPSIRLGIRLTNATLPTTVLLFLSIFVLTQGLDVLWRIPPADSWLTILGIIGHAFIVTGLLSASFIYYRDADRYLTSMINQKNKEKNSGI